jgi:hypothetical protein
MGTSPSGEWVLDRFLTPQPKIKFKPRSNMGDVTTPTVQYAVDTRDGKIAIC